MAPTETMASTIPNARGPAASSDVACVCSRAPSRRARTRGEAAIASGEAQIAVGTHALIQEAVEFADLAVAVVDEQHRFGVEQRQALVEGRAPHVLHMTATPIPRTLALTVYGDLAVSEIAEPPADRKPIVTAWATAEQSSKAYTPAPHLDAAARRTSSARCRGVGDVGRTAAEVDAAPAPGLLRGTASGSSGRLRRPIAADLMARFRPASRSPVATR